MENTLLASDSISIGEDDVARAQASAMSVNALRAATTSCGALVKGDTLAMRAGIACAAWRGARKAGPPVHIYQ